MTTLSTARRAATLRYSRYNRKRKAEFALDFVRRNNVKTVLLVGVSQYQHAHENIVENALIDARLAVTPTGIREDVEGWQNYVVADGRALPFPDKSYDLVYSNAVIEHVGREPEQRQFIAEHVRVGRTWIFTTPNKWFPVEAHSDVIFKHWRAEWQDQWGSVTRLVSPQTLKPMLPAGAQVHGLPWSPTLTVASG